PITFDDLRCGEFYDATLEKDGWNTADFDDSAWCSMIETDPARGKALLNETDRVVITKELKPVKIYEGFSDLSSFHEIQLKKSNSRPIKLSENAFYKPELKEYGTVFEFEENTACIPKLRIKGKKGQQIIIQAAEFCYESGEISFDNIHSYYPYGFCQRDIYTCKGEGVEQYIPSFTYHGARYFLVMGLDKEQICEDTLTMLVMNSDLAERGGFSCSDEIANALQENTRISNLANFVYFPTDCPHREKNGWTGDAAMSAEHMTQNLAVEKSLRQWLRMMCAAQRDDGAFSGIIPNTGWGYAWGNGHGPAWDAALIEIPYQTYIYRGDKEMFLECAGSLIKYLHFLTTKVRPDGLIRLGLGDWCHALRGGNSHNHICPNEVSDSIMCYNICKKCEFMFDVCGMKPQSLFAKTFGEQLLTAIRERLIDYDTMTVFSSCQCAQAMGLYYGIFEKGEEAKAYERLIELIHEADDHFDCGMLGVRTMFRVLAKHGDGALAYKMITRT
ncbi:MAG: family 78 glycoside hydrolase catalytic domain, partial [Clostridia bacterium]|nr:family 78 glycoside hydrolase catalytic domain [Clostridia bacterium]